MLKRSLVCLVPWLLLVASSLALAEGQQAGVQSARTDSADFVPVSLDQPEIHFRGVPRIIARPDAVEFHRFSEELLSRSKRELGFNPAKARNVPGGLIEFRTASPRVRLAFAVAEGMNRGSEFGVFADGRASGSHAFPAKDTMLEFELANDHTGPVTWAVSLPGFANVVLRSLEIVSGYELEQAAFPEKKIFVALGDSITHGTGQGRGSHLSWPFLLSRKLDYELFNLAVGGSGIAPGAARALAGLGDAQLVTILFGYNDWQGEGDSVDDFREQYRVLFSEVRAAQPGAVVVFISPLVTRRDVSKSTGMPIDGFRESVEELVREWRLADPKVHFIDGTKVSSYDNLQPAGSADVVHLTVEGAAMLSDALYPGISDLLQ